MPGNGSPPSAMSHSTHEQRESDHQGRSVDHDTSFRVCDDDERKCRSPPDKLISRHGGRSKRYIKLVANSQKSTGRQPADVKIRIRLKAKKRGTRHDGAKRVRCQ